MLVADRHLLKGTLTFPRRGAWQLQLEYDATGDEEPLSGQVTTSVGSQRLVGTVDPDRSRVLTERGGLTIYGGGGGLRGELEPKAYGQVPVRSVIEDILREAGETLSGTSDDALLNRILDRWTRVKGTASQGINEVLDRVGVGNWRVLDDGTVWVGEETWPEADLDAVEAPVTNEALAAGVLEWAPEDPGVRPGQSYDGQHVSAVTYTIDGRGIRGRLSLGDAASTQDRVRQMVREELDVQLRGLKEWPATVTKQDGSTLEVELDNKDVMPGLVAVPMVPGWPGLTLTVPAGARCRVRFAEGDPQTPEIAAWEHATALTLAVVGATGSADHVALAQKVLDELNSIKSDFDGHTHEYVAPLHPATPSAAQTMAPSAMTSPSSVACTKLKAE